MPEASDQLELERLKKGDRKVLERVYLQYYESCKSWVSKRFNTDDSEFKDVFQDSVIFLYEAARDRKLDSINCSIKTYLFAICRNQLLKRNKLQKRILEKESEVEIYYREWLENEVMNENASEVKNKIDTMDEPCKSILTSIYYHNDTIEEVVLRMNYPNKNVLKVQKSRCLKYLRKRLESIWKKI